MKPKVVAVVGQTASGKTSLSIEIAKRFDGEVISCDSRQVYKGLDIGTGKVTEEEMNGVPHHLLDIAEPSEVVTGADWTRTAAAAGTNAHSRGHLPIIAGGTFFWLDLLRGKTSVAQVKPNHELRTELELLAVDVLYEKLQILDPDRATTIDPHNRVRLIRAIEIATELGKVPKNEQPQSPYDWLIIGIDIAKENLQANIHTRLLQRIDGGMIEEAKKLHGNGLSYERMNELGLEYRYLAKYLQGELSKEQMIEQLEIKIRQYAKRQMTWLKRDKDIEWFAPENHEVIFRHIKQFLAE